MSNNAKKPVSIIGMIVGIVIIIIGISLHGTSTYAIGENIRFGADFYTEMYDVTKDVGHAINYAINDIVRTLSWLIISLGAIDVCVFAYLFVKANDVAAPLTLQNINSNVQWMANEMMRKSAEKDDNAPPVYNAPAPKADPEPQNEPDASFENTTVGSNWICGKCSTKNAIIREDCWFCGNKK